MNTMTKPLTDAEIKQYDKIVSDKKLQLAPLIKQAEETYCNTEVQKLVSQGLDEATAVDTVKSRKNYELKPDDILQFDDGRKATVGQVNDNPEDYNDKRLRDPLEPGEGKGKAIFYANEGITPQIYSHLHGGKTYMLSSSLDSKFNLNLKHTTTEQSNKNNITANNNAGTSEFPLISITELLSTPYKPNWLIRGHMEAESLGTIFGPPASAKSFIAMEISFCIAAGIDWNGHTTKQGDVVFLAGEGQSGLKKRFTALIQKYNTTPSNIHFSEKPAALVDEKNVQSIYDSIMKICPNPVLVVIDTLNRNIGDADENSSRDTGKLLNHISELTKATGATVLLVHHTGHKASDRGRGSSALRAGMDVEYQVTKKEHTITMTCTKAKEFEEPEDKSFDLKQVVLQGHEWFDDLGNPITSAILEPAATVKPSKTAGLTGQNKIVFDVLNKTFESYGSGKVTKLSDKLRITFPKLLAHEDDWRKQAYASLQQFNSDIKSSAQQKAFNRCKQKLLDDEIIVESKNKNSFMIVDE